MNKHRHSVRLPIIGLLMSALCWGVVWYPYRWLNMQGVSALPASMLTYVLALLLGFPWYRRHWRSIFSQTNAWLILALGAGFTNTAYVLAVIHGEIMRVALLFYLAPLWTMVFARLLLREKLSWMGYWIMALAFSGAVVMLWHPDGRWPLPANGSEWLGLVAGVGFAFTNVWARKTEALPLQAKALAIWVGCMLMPLLMTPVAMAMSGSLWHGLSWQSVSGMSWLVLLAVALAMFSATLLMQYGLVRVAASRAIVILLSELVVSALSSWWLADETLVGKEWVGAVMIMAASFFSGHLDQEG